MKYRAIIFDLDGVIVHTDRFHYLGWKKLANRLDIYFDEEINNRCRGVSRMESLKIVLERSARSYSPEERAAFAEEKNSYYRELLLTMTQKDVDGEVRNTLNTLKALGYKLAIGSSSKNAKIILNQVGLLDIFDAISDGTNISQSKPDPEVFLKAAEFVHETPGNCIVVEDAVAGIEAGRRCGMTTIAIGDATRAHVADYDIESISQLLDIV